ncbi:hypothetical protein LP415_18815 [Polaromonas sp. P1(28)-8]|nr:hypothetical protein LP415_18815 [Polaromonas sp. P1(28)-8]
MNKQVINLLLALLALRYGPAFTQIAQFPNKPVRVIVGAPAGGPSDALARLVSQKMSETLGQPFCRGEPPRRIRNIGRKHSRPVTG